MLPQGIIPQDTIPTCVVFVSVLTTKGPPESPEQAPSPPSKGPVQTLVSAKGFGFPDKSIKAWLHSKNQKDQMYYVQDDAILLHILL